MSRPRRGPCAVGRARAAGRIRSGSVLVLAGNSIQRPLRRALVGVVKTAQCRENTHDAVSATLWGISPRQTGASRCQAPMRPCAIGVRHVCTEHQRGWRSSGASRWSWHSRRTLPGHCAPVAFGLEARKIVRPPVIPVAAATGRRIIPVLAVYASGGGFPVGWLHGCQGAGANGVNDRHGGLPRRAPAPRAAAATARAWRPAGGAPGGARGPRAGGPVGPRSASSCA